MTAGLFRLLHRHDNRLAWAMAVGATADTALSAWQAGSFNLPRSRTAGETAIAIGGVAATVLTATVLGMEIKRNGALKKKRARDRE